MCCSYGSYFLINYSGEQSPWEANRFSATQEIPGKLWNPNVNYRLYKHRSSSTSARHFSLSWALKWTLWKQYESSWIWLIWLRIGTNGGPLRTWNWSFGFYKIPGISLVAEQLLASEEEVLCHEVCLSVHIKDCSLKYEGHFVEETCGNCSVR
jgi:hypothetical protein